MKSFISIIIFIILYLLRKKLNFLNNNNVEIFVAIFIFCIVLFLYLHIQYHLKTGEIQYIQLKDHLKKKEICDIRQPVMFDFKNDRLLESCSNYFRG